MSMNFIAKKRINMCGQAIVTVLTRFFMVVAHRHTLPLWSEYAKLYMNDICGVYNTHKNIKGGITSCWKRGWYWYVLLTERKKKKCEMVKAGRDEEHDAL